MFLLLYRNELLDAYTPAAKKLNALDKIHKVYEDYSLQRMAVHK